MAQVTSQLFAQLLDEWDRINVWCGKQPTACYLEEKYGPRLRHLVLSLPHNADLLMFLNEVLVERRQRIQNALHWKHDPLSSDYALVHLCYVTIEHILHQHANPIII
jgi:hypothetical protein